ncbi:hypothetical protein STHAL_21215 [Streptomyces halstedii]|uniref:Uncharacterized protein n=1 Tax=Streptomyces halstedii TaxID=1944 RepID=A0ABS6TUM6_STRHA|nr:hypothetical protein [Streptomyces halstedii]MBV7671975.1 hypothetical protein [Streptomyces halstedii]
MNRVTVPLRLDRRDAARTACGTGCQGFHVEGAVRGAGDIVAVVEVTVVDDKLGVTEPEPTGPPPFEGGAHRLQEGVLEDVAIDLSAHAGRQ